MIDSAKIYRMQGAFTEEQLIDACLETIRANGFEECYIRPVIYRGYGTLGVNPLEVPGRHGDRGLVVGRVPGRGSADQRVDVTISTWNRMAPNTLPALAKCGANYMNSQLINLEARARGFTEGIALTTDGLVSEGSGENIFVVWRGKIFTPGVHYSILAGITRDSVMTLARELGYEVVENAIPREALYVADEAFFTGTAAEVTPIRSVDGVPVGSGTRGEITRRLQEAYFNEVKGAHPRHPEWHLKVYP